jgi:hypothetical protein
MIPRHITDNMQRRFQMCLAEDGGQFQYTVDVNLF